MAIFLYLPKSESYLAYFAPVPSGPGWAWNQKKIYSHNKKLCWKNFGICSAHLRYLPKLSFLSGTQLAIFRIEYNTFSKAIWLIVKTNFQIIIIEEKTQFELNLTSFKLILACGDLSATTWLGWENMTKIWVFMSFHSIKEITNLCVFIYTLIGLCNFFWGTFTEYAIKIINTNFLPLSARK